MLSYGVQAEKDRRFMPKRIDLGEVGDREIGFTNGSDGILLKCVLGSLRITSIGPYPVTVKSERIEVFGQLIHASETRVLDLLNPGMIASGFKIRIFPSRESGKLQRLVITYQ